MRSLNKIFLMGNLGQDPELKVSSTGKPYCRLRLATSTSWMSAEDKREEKTEWHSVFTWGNTAERCALHLRKGALVFVEGSLTHWQGAQENEFFTAIQAGEVKFLNSPGRNASAKIAESLDNPGAARNHNAVAHPA